MDMVSKAEEAIAKVEALGPEAGRIFTDFDAVRIRADAKALDERKAAGEDLPLYGKLVSIKDLFDEKGKVTSAGSRLLKTAAPATADAPVIRRLKEAGALLVGRTSMSEFAYSGVGLNPHYGTPGCIFDKTRIPGGSSSGAALTVAHGICDMGLGTDTGGSVRIPSAVNGLYGFKPSQSVIPREGIHPLSDLFDSVGPLCATLDDALTFTDVLAGGLQAEDAPERPLRLALPTGAFTDGIDGFTQIHFARSCDAMRAAGHELVEQDFAFLPASSGISRIVIAWEALTLYGERLNELEEVGDPRVLKRIRFAETLSAGQVDAAKAERAEAVERFAEIMSGFDALVAPTLAIQPPTIAEAEEDFDRVNMMMLRNCSYINLADGCAMAMPVKGDGTMPGSLMVAGPAGADARILGLSRAILAALPSA
ncbi:amidase family protein [Nitratireductor basaltis]|uniref:Amidase, Asp-tRNAAsn/Glu-tRNAGln amidotransferase A subunit n=1 Tax=Nitratireductor basaltis TaxID=472175 RepID=A0A084U5C1_9HYPH|nr:amidase family protein [Nitratireductor basaltis]KFB08157.1 Amidase, Asp-tRNAAsn/Glu-tRNAGln amidotransferase A subunit [Nitratireductor basaltis]